MNPQSRRRQLHNSFKAELKELALDLFAKRGYEHTSYRDIAFTAGISLRTMPRFFREKENILLDDLDEGAKAFRGALMAQPRSLPPIEAFERAMISAEYPPYHLEYLLAAVICREQSSKLSATFNEFRLRWQTEVAAAIAEWLGISRKTEFPPIFWASTILTALEYILRAQAGEAGLAAELTDPAEVFALVFDNLRMMAALTASGNGVPHSLPATTLQLVI